MKNTKLFYLALITAMMQFFSCGSDDEKPQVPPTVTTVAPSNITTTSASVSGEITDTGNATITEAGFVYSSILLEPTTSDNKVEADADNMTAELTGLTSGTTYRVRAYAINKKGTGYGEVRTFETGNAPPVATNIQITGVLEVNKEVTATFTYTDPEGNAQGASLYQWYVANDATGAGLQQISGATGSSFLIQDAQNGKFLKVAITPVAQTGTTTGTEVSSTFTTAVGAETVTFNYNGVNVTYGTIISSATGKKWLDRNIGATRMAQSIDDYLAYGDSFQWGRLDDGHQLITRTGGNDADATGETGITSTVAPYEQSPIDVPTTNKFIIVGGAGARDWRNPQNNSLWQGVGGTNNPCPDGWRIPTMDELIAEGFTNGPDAFTKLKLTLTGQRSGSTGGTISSTSGFYWTSTIKERATPGEWVSVFLVFDGATYISINDVTTTFRRNGHACRCVKN